MLSKIEAFKWVSTAALAVSIGAGGIYLTGVANAHPKVTLWIIGVSLLVAIIFGIAGAMAIDPGPTGSGSTNITAFMSGQNNTEQQIVGNTGSVHIGDVNHGSSLSPPRDYRAEWLRLSEHLRQECGDRRADWADNNVLGTSWDIKGHDRKMCMAWSRQAGALLLKSPRVRAQLSPLVLNEPDDLSRWMLYLKEGYVFEWGPTFTGASDDGAPERIHTGSLNNLGEQSAKACIDCSTYET